MQGNRRQKQHDVQEILAWCIVLPFTSEAALAASAVYRNLKTANQLIEVRDLFIAATALTYDLPLMALNTGHFDRIDRLRLNSPLSEVRATVLLQYFPKRNF